MPYVAKDQRENVDNYIEIIAIWATGAGPGLPNYIITKLLRSIYDLPESQNYAKYNEIVGILECCKLEFYRSLIGPYEQTKLEENGDV